MFGHSDKKQDDIAVDDAAHASVGVSEKQISEVALPSPPEENMVTTPPAPTITPTAPPLSPPSASGTSAALPVVEPPASDNPPQIMIGSNPINNQPVNPPAVNPPAVNPPSSDASSAATPSAVIPPAASEKDLLNIKQQALLNLAPLISRLDQKPEEKFRTTMMLIQASDNPELVKEAYAAANAIPDEKARAQALLDIVNEINYFTQQSNASAATN